MTAVALDLVWKELMARSLARNRRSFCSYELSNQHHSDDIYRNQREALAPLASRLGGRKA